MGEVDGNRKEDGRKMERNSSIASEGKVDLLEQAIEHTSIHTHHREGIDQKQQSQNAVLSWHQISTQGGSTYRGDARGDMERSRSEGAGGSLFGSSSEDSSLSFSLSNASRGGDMKRTALIAWGRCRMEAAG